MKKIILCLFIIASVFAIAKPSGTWRKLEPEGEVPGKRWQHYMCPIGEDEDGNSKVLMINGLGDGNPHAYRECWLFEYNKGIGKWNKLKLDTIPDTYGWTTDEGNFINQFSKTKAILTFYSSMWLFDYNKMQWYQLDNSMRPSSLFINHLGEESERYTIGIRGTYLKENLFFSYEIPYQMYKGLSYLFYLHPDEPYYSPTFLTYELLNDESITKQGPACNYQAVKSSNTEKNFTHNNDFKNVTYIYTVKGYYDKVNASFMDISMQTYKWLFLTQEEDSLPEASKRAYSNIANNLTLIYKDTNTYILEYIPGANKIKTHKINCDVNPGIRQRGHRLAKIKDGTVMLFGGSKEDGWYNNNETWIFELTTGIKNNHDEDVKIYMLDDNIYLLSDEMKNVMLFNILGQEVMKCKDTRLDLTALPIGVYILQYIDTRDNLIKVIKLLKK